MTYAHTDQFYIDGAWVAPMAETAWHAVIDPATEQEIAQLAMGGAEDVNAAVAAAKAAFTSWSETSLDERVALLEKVLEIYKRRSKEVAAAITAEMGAPKSLSEGAQAAVGGAHIKATLRALKEFPFEETLPNGDIVYRQPIGVCGLITPWNWPINQIGLKVFAALAAGCTMVLKPSEITPLNAILFTEILDEAGVPAGVFNLVHGEGPVVGAALSTHPDIAMMSFTGSTRGGTAVSRDSADGVKRVALELGGKSPNIIFADCDLEKQVTKGVLDVFENTGQSCDAPTRMIVERSVYDEVVEIAQKAAEGQQVGDPTQAGDHMGPLASSMQFEKVQAMIQVGIDEGARLIAGGTGKPEGFETGYFVKPTVFADVSNQMRIAQEEIFGPVLSIIPFDTEEEAIAIANDTVYGLSSYVQTGDAARAKRVARKLQAGMVNVNGAYKRNGSPFGGYKLSGIGREGGKFGLEDFLEVKVVAAP